MLILGRIIIGLGVGIVATVIPIYLAEVAPAPIRGILVNLFSICIILGQFGALLVCLALGNRWRWMLALAVFPSIFQAIGFMFLIESPGWLFKVDKDFEGVQAIKKLYFGTENALIRIMQGQKEEADRIRTYQSIGFCKSMVQMCTTYKN